AQATYLILVFVRLMVLRNQCSWKRGTDLVYCRVVLTLFCFHILHGIGYSKAVFRSRSLSEGGGPLTFVLCSFRRACIPADPRPRRYFPVVWGLYGRWLRFQLERVYSDPADYAWPL